MEELIKYIEAENAKSQAWMAEDSANRFAGVISTDPSHWEAYGITTVGQYRHYMTVESYIEMFKAVHGIKPRWMDFSKITVEEMESEMNSWSIMMDEQAAATRKDINRLCDEHHCTEDDLKRWEVI